MKRQRVEGSTSLLLSPPVDQVVIRYFIVVDLIVLTAALNKVSDRNKVFVSLFYYYITEFKRLPVLKITNETIIRVQMEKLPFLKPLQCLQCGWTTAAGLDQLS